MQLSLLERDRARQLPLSLDASAPACRDDVVESPECALGVRLVDAWPNWPSHAVILSGASGTGKTFLAELWAARSGATQLVGTDLAGLDPLPHAGGAVLIEHIDIALRGERPRAAQTGLFHLLNTLRETRGHVLMTSRTPPGGWSLGVRDLASRLAGATHVALQQPSDAALEAVLHKLFADRQLPAEPATIAFLIARVPRSLVFARDLVERIDRMALAERRRVDRRLAAQALETF